MTSRPDPLEQLVEEWYWTEFGARPLPVRKILAMATSPMKRALGSLFDGKRATPHRVGRLLGKHCDDVVTSNLIVRREHDVTNNIALFYVERLSPHEQRKLTLEASESERERAKQQEIYRQPLLRRGKKLTDGSPLIYVSPPYSEFYTREKAAQSTAKRLRDHFFDATVDYVGSAYVVRVQSTTIDELERHCRKHGLAFMIREVARPSSGQSVIPSNAINAEIARVGYSPSKRLIAKAFSEPTNGGAVRMRPLSSWNPFNS